MAEPFDTSHILDLRFISVNIESSYNTTIEALRSRHENRNLESDQEFRSFSLAFNADEPASHEEFLLLKGAFDRAKGNHEGFYLKFPKIIIPALVPVRFDSPFRYRYVTHDECNLEIYWEIQDLRMIEIPAP